jgi:hypothetical protein
MLCGSWILKRIFNFGLHIYNKFGFDRTFDAEDLSETSESLIQFKIESGCIKIKHDTMIKERRSINLGKNQKSKKKHTHIYIHK